jgi:hypothetical protein
MEYANDGSLYGLLSNKEKKINGDTRWQLVTEASAAIAYVHKRNVLHRYGIKYEMVFTK